jgi:hypothetical protein
VKHSLFIVTNQGNKHSGYKNVRSVAETCRYLNRPLGFKRAINVLHIVVCCVIQRYHLLTQICTLQGLHCAVVWRRQTRYKDGSSHFLCCQHATRSVPQVTLSSEISTLCRLQGKKSRWGSCIGAFVTAAVCGVGWKLWNRLKKKERMDEKETKS